MMTENDQKQQPPLAAFLDKVTNSGLDNTRIKKNSLVVAKVDIPALGIFADQTYELQSIYLQGYSSNSGSDEIIEKIDLEELDLGGDNPYSKSTVPAGYTQYITLYSKMYHDNDTFDNKAIICTPEEVGLISMKDEVIDSIIFALPVLSFWLGTCFTFSTWYTQKYGGNFIDALFRS